MRQTYLVTYDICEPKRLRRVFRIMLGYGDHVQYSVFRCELTPSDIVELKTRLEGVIHHHEDQVLFVDVGPHDGRARESFSSLGRHYEQPERKPVIV